MVDPSKKVPDLKCEVPDLLLEVVDLKQEVPDLRSGGIPFNLTPGNNALSDLADARSTLGAILVGAVEQAVVFAVAHVVLRLAVESVDRRDRVALEVGRRRADAPR